MAQWDESGYLGYSRISGAKPNSVLKILLDNLTIHAHVILLYAILNVVNVFGIH